MKNSISLQLLAVILSFGFSAYSQAPECENAPVFSCDINNLQFANVSVGGELIRMKCIDGEQCNIDLKPPCQPCTPIDCGFTCFDKNTVLIHGIQQKCRPDLFCNDKGTENCKLCIRKKCDSKTQFWDCLSKTQFLNNDSNVIIDCPAEYVCNQNNVYPCDACIKLYKDEAEPSAPTTAPPKTTATTSKTTTTTKRYNSICKDGNGGRYPCRDGPPGRYIKCIWTITGYISQELSCANIMNDRTCRNSWVCF